MVRTAARLPKGTRISDHVTLGVLTATVSGELVDAVLAETGRQSQRQRRLPARVVVYYVMALALYAQASYGEVLRCLLEGVRWLRLGGVDLAVATKSAITRARIRLGSAPMQALFERLARPFATPGTPGAWYRGRRLAPQREADEGAVGQAQHLGAQLCQQPRRQFDLADVVAVQRHREDRVRAAFGQPEQAQLREAADAA